ncbi:MAG: hypothetical protein AAFV95_23300 [Bacteroidota bacterium]
MKNSRLLSYLKELNPKERKRFRDFVFSPYFNKNQKVRQLCEQLLRLAPAWDDKKLDRQLLYKALFPTEAFHKGRFNNLVSDLLHLLYDFLAQSRLETRPQLQRHLLLDELLRRELHRDIERLARGYSQLQRQTKLRHIDFYLDEYQLYEKLDRHFFSKGVRTYDENLQQKNDALDRFYLLSKLRMAADMTSRNLVVGSAYECHWLPDLLRHYSRWEGGGEERAVFEIYHQVLQMLQGKEGEKAYGQAKRLVVAHHHLFPQEELREVYIFILNYCIRQINSGNSRYFRELLDLYKAMLDSEVVFRNGYMPQWTFKNISTAGIRLKEFEWTEQFILRYQEQLLAEERPNAIAFNLAALYYAQKDYPRALSQLHNVEFINASYHLGAKLIQLKSYYELDESEAFLALIEASKKYISRNRQLSEHAKNANLNFLHFIRRLFQLKSSQYRLRTVEFKKKERALSERLEQLQPLANKDWLEEAFSNLSSRPASK